MPQTIVAADPMRPRLSTLIQVGDHKHGIGRYLIGGHDRYGA